MGRAPYNTLIIPYCKDRQNTQYCIFKRSDMKIWQFIAGGGEDGESPLDTAKRETFEESGILGDKFVELQSLCYVPSFCFSEEATEGWGKDVFVIPNYSFAVKVVIPKITLSDEHLEYQWVSYEEAKKLLYYDGDKTALWELKMRIENKLT